MSKWDFKPTAEVMENYNKNRKLDNFTVFVRNAPFNSYEYMNKAFNAFNNGFKNNDRYAFTELVEAVYPYWRNYVAHVEISNGKWLHESIVSERLVYDNRRLNSGDMPYQILQDFLSSSFGESEAEVGRWLTRIEELVVHTDYTGYISKSFYTGSFPIENIFELMDTRVYLWEGAIALDKGFNVPQVKKISSHFVRVGYTPNELEELLNDYSYAQINKVASLFEKVEHRQPLDDYRALINLFGRNKKELWAVLRNTGLGYGRQDTFEKLAFIEKELTHDEFSVLAVHNPNLIEAAPVLMKLKNLV